MSHANKPSHISGFTLVEVLVIAPIALLVITGFVALMVVMVGDAIATRTDNVMTYEAKNAINAIERDVRLSTEFLATSGNMPTPQGKDGGTLAFSSSSDLILGSIATNKNPLDSTRSLIHYNTPFACNSETAYQNRLFFITVIYTVRDNSLWRRTYVPTPSGTLCNPAWQVNSCAPGYTSAQTQCQSTDEEILKNVSSFNVDYFVNSGDTISVAKSAAPTASTINVSIETERTAAGRDINVTSSGRSTKLSSREINLAPPDSPVVTGTNSGRTAVFSWPGVPTASSYIVKYNINGGGWITSSENSIETSFSVPANHGDTVSVEIMARNTTGASSKATASITIPLWINCSLEDGWEVLYSVRECGITKTKSGVVVIQGLLNSGLRGTHSTLFRLPPGYRPFRNQVFEGVANGYSSVRLQVTTSGLVQLIEGSSTDPGTPSPGWLSVGNLIFLSSEAFHTAPELSLQNGWKHYYEMYSGSGAWPHLTAKQDTSGRVHLSGLVGAGTYTPSGTVIAALPAEFRSSQYLILPARAANGINQFGITEAASGNIVARGFNPSSWISTQTMYYPASHTDWTNFSTVTGVPGNGQIGNSWTAYGGIHATPAYTKSSDGIVTMKGLIRNGSTASGTVIAQLPEGYRPHGGKTIRTVGMAHDNVNAVFDIYGDGRIVALKSDATWTSLSSISFMAGP